MLFCSAELNRKANQGLKPFVEKLRKAKKAIDARGAQEGTACISSNLMHSVKRRPELCMMTDGAKTNAGMGDKMQSRFPMTHHHTQFRCLSCKGPLIVGNALAFLSVRASSNRVCSWPILE